MVHRHLGQLFPNNAHIGGVGHHPEILHRAETLETVDGELNERASTSQDVDELFGVFGRAQRPKAATDAAGHDNDMVFHVLKNYFVPL